MNETPYFTPKVFAASPLTRIDGRTRLRCGVISGGLGFTAHGHSQVVQKISCASGSAAVTVMVPNSLGPGELLLRSATHETSARRTALCCRILVVVLSYPRGGVVIVYPNTLERGRGVAMHPRCFDPARNELKSGFKFGWE